LNLRLFLLFLAPFAFLGLLEELAFENALFDNLGVLFALILSLFGIQLFDELVVLSQQS
jgi:hypothetical protein